MDSPTRPLPEEAAVETARRGRAFRFTLPLDLAFEEGTPSFWPALVILLGGSVSAFVLWKTVDAHLGREEQRQLEDVANHIKSLGERSIEQELVSLETLSSFRGLLPKDEDAWRIHAEQYLHEHPCILLISVAEVRPEGVSLGASEDDESSFSWNSVGPPAVTSWFRELDQARVRTEDDELRDSRLRALASRQLELTGPLRMPPGPPVFEIELPTVGATQPGGLLAAILRPADIFEPLMTTRTQRYSVSLLADGEELCRFYEPAENAPLELVREPPLQLRTGDDWHLRVVPSQDYQDRTRRRFFARAMLGTGVIISILFALVVHFGRVAGSRARALSLARIRSLEGREAEVRELNHMLEARVKERTEELQQSINELETFNYSISHDLRSPLGAILNFTAILNEDYKDRLDEAGRRCLDRVAHCAKVAVSMMDSLLSFSRIGRDKMNLEPLEVENLVKSTYPDLRVLHQAPNATVTIGKLPSCRGDREMMRLVIENLLSNALKFSRKAPAPSIEVGGYETDEECVYFIRDNGVGFDMKDAKKLFGVFERMHSDEEYEGHGVGLAITRRIVQRHMGRVWAEATPGKGATFYFSIPKERRRREERC